MALRVVLYARVSKLSSAAERETGETKSVGQQLDVLRARASSDGVEVVGEFRDDGVSASRYARNSRREGWQATMDMILSGGVDELWLWELSRATRDRPVWAALIGACMGKNVTITVNGRAHDPNDPDDAFMLDLGAALAVKESATTSARIQRDVAARAAKGLPHGKVPYGFRRVYDPVTRSLIRQEPDPETAPVVRELVRRVLAGESLGRLATELNSREVPSPETIRKRRVGGPDGVFGWRADQVRDVTASPAAAGLRIHRGVVLDGVEAAWEPIVSKTDHMRLTTKYADPSRRRQADAAARYLLAGLARCGECDGEIRRIKNRGVPSYACMGNRYHHYDGARRFCVARKLDVVDAYVEQVIVDRLSRPDAVQLFTPAGDELAQAKLETVQELRAEHAQLIVMAEARKISVVAFSRLEAALLPRIAAAEEQVAASTVPAAVMDVVVGDDVAGRWGSLHLEQKREIIRVLVDIRIRAAGRGSRKFNPDLIEIRWKT